MYFFRCYPNVKLLQMFPVDRVAFPIGFTFAFTVVELIPPGNNMIPTDFVINPVNIMTDLMGSSLVSIRGVAMPVSNIAYLIIWVSIPNDLMAFSIRFTLMLIYFVLIPVNIALILSRNKAMLVDFTLILVGIVWISSGNDANLIYLKLNTTGIRWFLISLR